MHETHIHVLCNLDQVQILVFNSREPDEFNSTVQVSHYKPGWGPQTAVSRQDVKSLLAQKVKPLLMYLDYPPTHFSAMVQSFTTQSGHRNLRHGSSSAGDGSIDIVSDSD